MTLGSVGLVCSALGRYDDALTQLSRSLAIKRKAFGDDHVRPHSHARASATSTTSKATIGARGGGRAGAGDLGASPRRRASPRGDCAAQPRGGAPRPRRCQWGRVSARARSRTKLSIAIEDLADTELAIAQACWAAGNRERTRSLARQARTIFRASGIRAEQLAAPQAWLLAVDPRLAAEQ